MIAPLMDVSSVGLKANACFSHVKRGVLGSGESGIWGDGSAGASRIRAWESKVAKNVKSGRWVGGFKAGVAFSDLTSDVNQETLINDPYVIQAPMFGKHKPDPKSVASIILGGGPGAQLFPLTSTRATPAVLAATQSPGEAGMNWFQGTADAVRQFIWVFEDNRNKNIDYIMILSGDQLYRMDYMDFVQRHIDTGADITISCVPVSSSRASDYGIVKIDKAGHIIQFSEKPKGADLEAMKDENTFFRLSHQDTIRYPYIASMGVYVFNRNTLLELLRWTYPKANDFGLDILPSAVKAYKAQAYIFEDYWDDIGTIKSFYDANLALTEQPPKFQFYDPRTPIFTSPRFLPPTKIEKCRILDSIISHGCFLHECSIEHSIVGVRSRIDYGAELKDALMLGADLYETEAELASILAEGKVPIGVGQNTKIRNCIIDMNARIGKNVVIANKDGVQEADRPSEGFYIRFGITIIMKNATIKDGTVI
ncbi:glucose-1-phosphate adenylyltransferase large subunit 1-like isoform X2 [Musa acuminata AAA Group]|uniref:glucose-1-phosphate adenylyltransferase large subunit 1-like isoform X2 n=1 Tax=Musa acuminata AAA Group TaxID=214697 RepID=UPI0008A0E8FE|nr:PREDICTED: glucose-1-phosphate adenylyltransferase large subunit 1-like isoform X2 [Musa acuminata subsp. malaccensis]